MEDVILIKDLPPQLTSSIFETIAFYTIAFLRIDEADVSGVPSLLGSGVLVSLGSTRASLTADHVARALPTSGRITLFLGRTTQPHSVEIAALIPVTVGRGRVESEGPDLAMVLLAPHIAGAIAAKKNFYNLDVRRDRLLTDPPELRDGAWFAQGFLEERTTVLPDPLEEGLTKYFYNFTGVGGPESIDVVGAFDYFEYPVSFEARPNSPVSWGGMSGGGLWQVPLKREDGKLVHLPPFLSGVMFYQHATTPSTCGIKAHARQSIYGEAYRVVQNREP